MGIPISGKSVFTSKQVIGSYLTRDLLIRDLIWYGVRPQGLGAILVIHWGLQKMTGLLHTSFLKWIFLYRKFMHCDLNINEGFFPKGSIDNKPGLPTWANGDQFYFWFRHQLALIHWGQVTHIYVNKLTSTGSDNGLTPDRPQAIIWTNAGI